MNYTLTNHAKKASTIIIEISVTVSQKMEINQLQDPALSIILSHIPNVCITPLQGHLLNHGYCYSIHDSQKLETT